jgi:hypothetical protein
MHPISFVVLLLQMEPGSPEPSLFRFFIDSGPMAKVILAILVLFSLGSWAVMIGKLNQYRRADRQSAEFLDVFHRSQRFSEVNALAGKLHASPLVGIFQAGYAEIDSQIKNAPEPERPGEKKAYRITSLPALQRTLTRAVNVEVQGSPAGPACSPPPPRPARSSACSARSGASWWRSMTSACRARLRSWRSLPVSPRR